VYYSFRTITYSVIHLFIEQYYYLSTR